MSTQEESVAHKDCLACRLSSGAVLSLASLYVAYHGLKRHKPVERSLMMASAGVICGLGVARMLDLPPFGKSKSQ